MAIIKDTFSVLVDTPTNSSEFTNVQANVLIMNYWGSISSDKTFCGFVDFFKKLFVNNKKVALRVVNINDPNKVRGHWIPYNGMPLDKDRGKNDVYYFVMTDDTFGGAHGLSKGTDTNMIVARLGKDEGNYCAIFYAANCILGEPGGTGNTNGNPGIKIPQG
jgi:hypothetical protein